MQYHHIDLQTWPRRDYFNHFIQDVRCVVSLTCDIDVTDLVSFHKTSKHRFYPTMLYLVAKTLNGRDEFKIRYDEAGNIILWDFVSPSYVVFHPEDEQFTRLVTEYAPDYDVFYDRVASDMALHRDKRGFEVPFTVRNTFDASCLPWISYRSLDLHVFDAGTYLAPVVTWGKYQKDNGRWLMPLSLQIHHAVADGFHIARFFSELQAEIDIFTP